MDPALLGSPGNATRIGLLGGAGSESLEQELRDNLADSEITSFTTPGNFFSATEAKDFDFVVLSSVQFTHDDALLLRRLKLLEREPGILVVTQPQAEPAQILQWLKAGADRVVLHTDRFSEEAMHHIAALERQRKASNADTIGRVRSVELLRRLTEKARRFEEFGMTVAHDIRGPLGNIQMQLEYLLDSYSTELPGRSEGILRRVIGNAERLQKMVQSMYQYAKLGAQAAQKTLIELEPLVQTVITDLNVDERIDVEIELTSLPVVWGNSELLRRLFLNLITNAIKYSDKQSIVIKVEGSPHPDTTLGKMATITVEDNGPGIPVAERANLLSMYSRGVDEKADGLGVGLAVVHRICELHFGRLEIGDSTLGGAKFSIELPIEPIVGL